MREELTRIGFEELSTPEEVDRVLGRKDGTVLVVVNSVCGCAAGKARPGVALALRRRVVPDHLATVFAGMELEASPQIALFKGGDLVHLLERKDIEGCDAEEIAADLAAAFDHHCGSPD
jgi:hypothetical protein